MIWGEASNYFTSKQEHKQALELRKLDAVMATQQHKDDMARISLLHTLGIKELQVKSAAEQEMGAISAFVEAQKQFGKPTGVKWVDAWNASVRPAYATVALTLWVLSLYQQSWVMMAFDIELSAAIAGFFFADRTLTKRGK